VASDLSGDEGGDQGTGGLTTKPLLVIHPSPRLVQQPRQRRACACGLGSGRDTIGGGLSGCDLSGHGRGMADGNTGGYGRDVGRDNMCDTLGTNGPEIDVLSAGTGGPRDKYYHARPLLLGLHWQCVASIGRGSPVAEGMTSSNMPTTALSVQLALY
jgi:hypothetical protein